MRAKCSPSCPASPTAFLPLLFCPCCVLRFTSAQLPRSPPLIPDESGSQPSARPAQPGGREPRTSTRRQGHPFTTCREITATKENMRDRGASEHGERGCFIPHTPNIHPSPHPQNLRGPTATPKRGCHRGWRLTVLLRMPTPVERKPVWKSPDN